MDAYASVGMPVELPPLELRQTVHRHRAELPARRRWGSPTRSSSTPTPASPISWRRTRCRCRRSSSRTPPTATTVLQGQLPVPHVDRRDVDHRLPAVLRKQYIAECEERYGDGGGRGGARRCHALRNYGVDRYKRPPKRIARRRSGAAQGARGATCSSRSTTCGARCPRRDRASDADEGRGASPASRRRTCSTSSRRTRRCSSPGSARSCASCARSRSTSTRSARRR